MHAGVLGPYEQALRASGKLGMQDEHGAIHALDVDRFLGPVRGADLDVVRRCRGPVLDVGCGPGRFVGELSRLGVAVLGVDIADAAVAITHRLGLPALRRSVFDSLPGEGRWPTVLLMDGNIGIGGDPCRLLTRLRQLLRPGGQVIVEASRREDISEALRVRFHVAGHAVGDAFEWAVLGADAIRSEAANCGYSGAEVWTSVGRTFVSLSR